MSPQGSDNSIGFYRIYHLLAALSIAAIVAVIYSGTLDASFHFDGLNHIAGNPRIRSLDNLLSILRSSTRGISEATFALNYAWGGYDVTGYHVVNIAIHAANSILVYFILFLTFLRVPAVAARAGRLAFGSALIFAVHPIQTQAVTYITQRHEILSAFFCLFALLFFTLALRAATHPKRVLLYAAIPVFYLLAFYSKEIAITLPAIILVFDLYFTGFKGKGSFLKRWPLHVVMALLLIFFVVKSLSAMGGLGEAWEPTAGVVTPPGRTAISPRAAVPRAAAVPEVSGDSGVADERVERLPSAGFKITGLSPAKYLLTEFNVLTYYMVLLAVPRFQNIDYDFPLSDSLFETPSLRDGTRLNYAIPPPIVSLVIILIILATALYLLWRFAFSARRGPAYGGAVGGAEVVEPGRGLIASFFILWFFITLSPTSSVVPIVDVIFEHRLYLASLGFSVIVVMIVDWACVSILGRVLGGEAGG